MGIRSHQLKSAQPNENITLHNTTRTLNSPRLDGKQRLRTNFHHSDGQEGAGERGITNAYRKQVSADKSSETWTLDTKKTHNRNYLAPSLLGYWPRKEKKSSDLSSSGQLRSLRLTPLGSRLNAIDQAPVYILRGLNTTQVLAVLFGFVLLLFFFPLYKMETPKTR